MKRHVFLILMILASTLPFKDAFSVGPSRTVVPLSVTNAFQNLLITKGRHIPSTSTSALRTEAHDNGDDSLNVDFNQNKRLASAYNVAKIASSLAWIVTAYIALSFHPDPKFKDCTLRHNVLTMSQAYAFPLPVLWASFESLCLCAKNSTMRSPTARRLGLAVSVASFWLAASMAFPTKFAFGYDLYKQSHKIAATMIHTFSGLFTLGVLLRSYTPRELCQGLFDSPWKLGPKKSASDKDSFEKNSSLLATGSIGLLWFSILPIISPYPLATVPTILGKRLSRPASAFTLLGSVMLYCLKEGINSVPKTAGKSLSKENDNLKRTLNLGLAIGSGFHLALIALKLIGVDGGGWILPGSGLWEVYPAMMSVPFAAGVSMLVHAVVCIATCSS